MRFVFILVAVFSAVVAGLSVGLTHLYELSPCPLCIFQRLMFMILAVLGLAVALIGNNLPTRLLGGLTALVALGGVGVASYHSWLERQPAEAGLTCVGVEPNIMERIVDWFGQRVPDLFLATGVCNEMGPSMMGVTMANASVVLFLLVFLTAAWGVWVGHRDRFWD